MADKKKRGEAGSSNAKNIPFRYHGGTVERPSYNLSRVPPGTPSKSSIGMSKHMQGMYGGTLFAKLGYRFNGDQDYINALS